VPSFFSLDLTTAIKAADLGVTATLVYLHSTGWHPKSKGGACAVHDLAVESINPRVPKPLVCGNAYT